MEERTVALDPKSYFLDPKSYLGIWIQTFKKLKTCRLCWSHKDTAKLICFNFCGKNGPRRGEDDWKSSTTATDSVLSISDCEWTDLCSKSEILYWLTLTGNHIILCWTMKFHTRKKQIFFFFSYIRDKFISSKVQYPLMGHSTMFFFFWH